MDLVGKVAIVTGASRGVGAATAVALAQAGCSVTCAARSTTTAPQRTAGTLDETVDRVNATGGRGLAVATNLAERDEVLAMVDKTVDEFGGVDILVNNAAITFIGDLEQPLHRHDLTMAVNYMAPYLAIRASYPHMERRGGGAIVNISSAAALMPYPNMLAYSTSKVALEQLTLHAARELYPKRIAVNCFRIDVPVASEGFVANTRGLDHTDWEPCEVAAEGIVWMLRQPLSYSGRRESRYGLRLREGIMTSKAERPYSGAIPPTELFDGLYEADGSHLREPYE